MNSYLLSRNEATFNRMTHCRNICLPVIIISEKATSRHINILFFFLLLLLSSTNRSNTGSRSGTCRNGYKLLKSFLNQLLHILSLHISNQLLDLLILNLGTNNFKDNLEVTSLLPLISLINFYRASRFRQELVTDKH